MHALRALASSQFASAARRVRRAASSSSSSLVASSASPAAAPARRRRRASSSPRRRPSTSSSPSRRRLLVAAASFFATLAPGRASAAPDASSCEPLGKSSSVAMRAAGGGGVGGGDDASASSEILDLYPGTALTRMENARDRAASLTEDQLSRDWSSVRALLLWAAGLRDLTDVAPGAGNTGHCFNDFNHVDATTMSLSVSDNENRGQVSGIAFGNRLGPGIKVASDPDLGPGGSWCTCAQGGRSEPPEDVAHLQFRSAIAWKLGAFYLTLVPIRPRSHGERRSLRTFPGVSLRPGSLAFNPRPRCL
jgi:hypothetical protein